MAATSFHKPTGKYLTSFGKDAKAGDMPTISHWSTSKMKRHGLRTPSDGRGSPKTCEFTTYLLGEPVAFDERFSEPLFELSVTPFACALDYDGHPTAEAILRVHAMPDLDRHSVLADA